jgi:hypothetical protein
MSTGNNLIFLISQPRAGSTLLQKVLGAHPEIHTLSEPWIALHPLFALRAQGASANYSHALAHAATTDFLAHIPGGENTYYEGVRLLLNHLYNAALAPSGKSLFLDKTPRYYLIIDELRRVFPDARFVFLIRNPLAVFSSILEAWIHKPHFGHQYAFRYDLMHDLFTAPELLAHAIANPAPNTAVIHYEDLVKSPADTVTRLCQQLHLPFHHEMIEYGKNPKAQRWTFGDQRTVYSEQNPIPTRADRWQRVLPANPGWHRLAHSYLQTLGPCRTEPLGYNFASLAAALGPPDSPTGDFLSHTVLTPFYGDSCNYVAQLTFIQEAISRAQCPTPQ